MQYQLMLYRKKNNISSPILNKIKGRAPIRYQSITMKVNAIQKSLDTVAWILEEAGKSDSIDQMNVMEVTLRTEA